MCLKKRWFQIDLWDRKSQQRQICFRFLIGALADSQQAGFRTLPFHNPPERGNPSDGGARHRQLLTQNDEMNALRMRIGKTNHIFRRTKVSISNISAYGRRDRRRLMSGTSSTADIGAGVCRTRRCAESEPRFWASELRHRIAFRVVSGGGCEAHQAACDCAAGGPCCRACGHISAEESAESRADR